MVVLIAAVMVSTNAGATAKIVNSGLTWPAAATIPQRVFIAGDSIALAMAVHNGSQWVPSMTVSNYARMGCGLVPGTTVFDGVPNPFGNAQCEGWQQGWRTEVQRNHPEASIIVPGIWDLADRKIDDRIIMVGTPEHHRLAVAAYKEAIQAAGGGSGVEAWSTSRESTSILSGKPPSTAPSRRPSVSPRGRTSSICAHTFARTASTRTLSTACSCALTACTRARLDRSVSGI